MRGTELPDDTFRAASSCAPCHDKRYQQQAHRTVVFPLFPDLATVSPASITHSVEPVTAKFPWCQHALPAATQGAPSRSVWNIQKPGSGRNTSLPYCQTI